jgi:tight adherence protein C
MGLAAALAGFVLPDLWLLVSRRSRRRRIRRALSFFLDLVVALLHSGLTVERSVLRAARDGFLDPHPLAEEVMLLGKELDLGQDSAVAFVRLAERTGVAELHSVAAAMKIGLRTGAGVEATLERQADLLRFRYREEGLQRIHRMAVLTMVPVFLCGVPLYAVIIFFPAVVEFFTTWRMIRPL